MKLDIKKAFITPFNCKGWFWKLSILGIIYTSALIFMGGISKTVPFCLIFFIVGLILAIVSSGYFSQFIHNEINDVLPGLPDWKFNFVNYFKKGFELMLVYLGNLFLFIFLFLILIIPAIIIYAVFEHKSEFIAYVILLPLMVTYTLVNTVVYQLIMCSYADKFCCKDGYLSGIFDKRLFKVKKEIAISLIITGLISISLSILADIFQSNVFIMIFTPYLMALALLVPYNLAAQTYKIAKNRLVDS